MENKPTAYEVVEAQNNKILELLRGVKKVEVVCECDELEHTCNMINEGQCAGCDALGRWDSPLTI